MQPILLDLPVPIITPRLVLRQPVLSDAAAMNALYLDSFEELSKTLSDDRPDEKPSIEESEMYIKEVCTNWIQRKDEHPYLTLFLFNKNEEFMGECSFQNIKWEVPCLEIGYWIGAKYAGQGYMTEAVNALTQYAFKQMGMKRVAITCDVLNVPSKKIPERLGFQLEGILKASHTSRMTNSVSDTVVYARYDLSDLPELAVSW